MSAARVSTLSEVHEALQRRDLYDGAHRAVGDLERSLRDVDQDDVRVYLGQDPCRVREYLDALVDVEYERGEQWAN